MNRFLLVALGSLFLLAAVWADDKDKDKDKKPPDKEAPKQDPDKTPPGPLPLDKLISKNKDLVPILVAALKDSDAQVRQTTAYVLANLGKDAVPGLTEALASKDADLRANAAYVLGSLGKTAQDAMPALLLAMKDENPEVRQRAAFAIQRILADTPPPQPPMPPMPPATDDPDSKPGAAARPAIIPASWFAPGMSLPADPGLLYPRGNKPPGPLPSSLSY